MVYYQEGRLDLRRALITAIGLLLGNFVGDKIAQPISSDTMKKLYGGFLLVIGLRYLLFR